MKMLFIGDLTVGCNSRSLLEGFNAEGHTVWPINTSRSVRPPRGSALWRSIRELRSVTGEENVRVLSHAEEICRQHSPDIILAVKTVAYDQARLLGMPAKHRVHLSYDDVSNPDNISPQYLAYEHAWTSVVTTKRHNVPEMIERGVKDVIYVWGAYDPRFRFISTPVNARRFRLGFIGAARPDRIDLPKRFAAASPGSCVVYGPRWRRHYPFGVRGVRIRSNVLAEHYTLAANSIRVGLVLLNSENRDLHTNRSFETPATGQLVLAQRTVEHAEMFDEEREAMFFDDLDEIPDILAQLTGSPGLLEKIALAGHRRITSHPNTYQDRARQIISHIAERH